MFIEPAYSNIGHKGWIEVISGPMFSGKTEELIRRIKRAQIARENIALFKPAIDQRYSNDAIVSHDQNDISSITVQKPIEIYEQLGNGRVIGIDEAQFFDKGIVQVVEQLALDNHRVIVSGLDMDYQGKPFEPVPQLLAIAEFITKVHAICVQCRNLATHSYRKTEVDGQILVGEQDFYEPLCRKCFHEANAVGSTL